MVLGKVCEVWFWQGRAHMGSRVQWSERGEKQLAFQPQAFSPMLRCLRQTVPESKPFWSPDSLVEILGQGCRDLLWQPRLCICFLFLFRKFFIFFLVIANSHLRNLTYCMTTTNLGKPVSCETHQVFSYRWLCTITLEKQLSYSL